MRDGRGFEPRPLPMQTRTQELRAWSAPRSFEGQTVVCIGGGPSLTRAQVEACAGLVKIGINDAYRVAELDVLYACDPEWWDVHQGVSSFSGPKVTLSEKAARKHGLLWMRNTGQHGYDPDPTALRTGQNGGYQALHLAVHMGARRVLLLGYDMKRSSPTHWFGDHPEGLNNHSPYRDFLRAFPTIVEPLRELGVEVINCTPGSALEAFPRMDLVDATR